MIKLDLRCVVEGVKLFKSVFTALRPFYAVKCNPHSSLIRTVFNQGCGYDCASVDEVLHVLYINRNSGIDTAKDIIHANPQRSPEQIQQLKQLGIEMYTFDSEYQLLELIKADVKDIVLRLCPHSQKEQVVKLGQKFGLDGSDARRMLHICVEKQKLLRGFCFHMGYPVGGPEAVCEMITDMRTLIEYGLELGAVDLSDGFVIDIGGGFVSPSHIKYEHTIESYSIVNDMLLDLKRQYPGVKLMAEPGRFFAEDCTTFKAPIGEVKDSVIRTCCSMIPFFMRDITFKNPLRINVFLTEETLKTTHPFTLGEKTLFVGNGDLEMDFLDATVSSISLSPLEDYVEFYNVGAYTVSFLKGPIDQAESGPYNIVVLPE